MEPKILIERLCGSIADFTASNPKILIQDAHEDAISVELIGYFKKHFPDFPYDINFNYDKRVVNNILVKKRTMFFLDELPASKIPKGIDLNDPLVMKEILPDIIFHDLNSQDHNFLIVEVKKSTNKNQDDRAMDILKLEAATSCDLNYEFGAFIDFQTGDDYSEEAPYKIKIYSDGEIIYEQ
ncbi:MAG: hypothetical protein JST86_00970 [Bacteroidetes bacterium]|nr:hypothetical protein [Bacteroidota bacterium]